MFGNASLTVILSASAVAAGFLLLLWGLAGIGRKKPTPPALDTPERRVVDERQLHLQAPPFERFFHPLFRSLAKRARRLTPGAWVSALEHRIRLAGSPRAWTVERVLAIKLLLALAALVIGLLWIAAFSLPGGDLMMTLVRIVLVPALVLAVYLMPDFLLGVRGRERQRLIQTNLPDALDQMSISVEAGLGFDSAVQRVVESGSGPLVEELHHTLREVSLGVPRRQALRNLVERTDVAELRHFVLAVTQAEEYGLPIANVLRVQSRELRVIRRQRAEERALKIPVKIVLPLVFCIFPALFVVILVPAVIRIMEVLFS